MGSLTGEKPKKEEKGCHVKTLFSIKDLEICYTFFKQNIIHWTIIWNTKCVIHEVIVMLPYGFQMKTKGSRYLEIIPTFYIVNSIHWYWTWIKNCNIVGWSEFNL